MYGIPIYGIFWFVLPEIVDPSVWMGPRANPHGRDRVALPPKAIINRNSGLMHCLSAMLDEGNPIFSVLVHLAGFSCLSGWQTRAPIMAAELTLVCKWCLS